MLLRNAILAMTVLAGMLVAALESVPAQDDPSQRMLPLPQRDLPDMRQQMELLKKLRSLIESRQQQPAAPPAAEDSKPPADPQQFEQLRNALKNLEEKLPPGFVPPDLSSMPPEQIKKALENPSVQQQMREMLKQFSKDGVLPPGSNDRTSPPLPPIPAANNPVRPEDRNPQPPENSPNHTPSEVNPENDDDKTPSPLPPSSMKSLQDFLKKFTENPAPNTTPSEPPRPKPLRRKEYSTSPNQPRTNDAPQVNPVPEPRRPGAETPTPDAPLPPNPSPSNRSPQSAPNPGTRNPRTSNPGIVNPQNTNPPGEPRANSPLPAPNADQADTEAQQQTLQALQKLMEEMAEQMQRESGASPQPDGTPRSGVLPPQGSDARTPQTTPPNNSSSNDSSNADPLPDLPSMPEFLKEQLKELQRSSDNRSTIPGSSEDRNAALPQQTPPRPSPTTQPNQQTQRDPVPQSSAPEINPPSQRTPPPMDIQKELERNGFGGTLKKIVERAKQESRQPKPSPDDSTTPGGTAGADPKSGPGLEQSMIRMLDGMKDDLAEIAKDGGFREPSRRSEPRRQNPSRRNSGTQSNSTLEKMRKAASELFAGPANSPQRNSPPGGSSSGFSTPSLDAQFDLTPVLVLAALLAAVAAGFFGFRFLNQRMAATATIAGATTPITPAEIQNRADVIRAFHEFALRSTKSVQSWWTHRAVERVIVTAAPERKAAVETLANAYEQARYLPQETEFSSEQIQSARNALQQCSTGAPV